MGADAQATGEVDAREASGAGLRLLIFDHTCRRLALHRKKGAWRPAVESPLTFSWMAGNVLYRAMGRLDHAKAITSWEEALDWLAEVEPERPIDEIQYWGHGKWGEVRVDREVMDEGILDALHPLHDKLCRVRERLSGPDALWWFRTCETFGAHKGHAFAKAWSSFMNCRAAGHTFIIGPWQSGLHQLRPGEEPTWSPTEGLAEGNSPERPREALWSRPWHPNTISCLGGAIPEGY